MRPQGSLNTYRFCDNVWTFVLNDVEFREVTDLVKVDKVKIVACDGKSESKRLKLLLLATFSRILMKLLFSSDSGSNAAE